jgi:hypothetical protein
MRDENVVRFIKNLRKICEEKEVTLYLPRRKSLVYSKNIRTAGYFGGEPPTLACARNSPVFLEVLVHESCHLDQYFEDYKFFNRGEDSNMIDQWLSGKEIRNIEKYIKITQEIELDCEKRAVKKIIQNKLPININHYVQKSNAYIWFHNYMCKRRFWPEPNEFPYNVMGIWKQMPARFLPSYEKMPARIEKIFDKQYTPSYNIF